MDIKETAKDILDSFFIIFTCATLGMVIYVHILGLNFVPLRDIVACLVSSILTSLAGIILFSSKEPKRLEMLVRHCIHLFVIVIISLSVASYMGWILWSIPITVIRFMGLIIGIYITVHAIIFYESKKLANKLNEKLKERYKG